MQLTVEKKSPDLAELRVKGHITATSISPVGDPLCDLVGPAVYSQRVLIDFSEVPFIDSSGVGWLIRSHKRFKQNSGQLVLHSLSPIVSKTLAVLSLKNYFEIASTAAEAQERLGKAAV